MFPQCSSAHDRHPVLRSSAPRGSIRGQGIGMKQRTIKALPVKSDQKGIGQGVLDLGIHRERRRDQWDWHGRAVRRHALPITNVGWLRFATSRTRTSGRSVRNGTRPNRSQVQAIKGILSKIGLEAAAAHIECLTMVWCTTAIRPRSASPFSKYYAFDTWRTNCQPEARDNFRILAGTKLREMIYSQVGYVVRPAEAV